MDVMKPFSVSLVIVHDDRGFCVGLRSRMGEAAFDTTQSPDIFNNPMGAVTRARELLEILERATKTTFAGLPPPPPEIVDEVDPTN